MLIRRTLAGVVGRTVKACGAPATRSVLREDRWTFDMGHWGWFSGGEAIVCFMIGL